MPEPPLSIKLRYVGSAVEDGTMPIEEVILALRRLCTSSASTA
jgi:hypothetical protein